MDVLVGMRAFRSVAAHGSFAAAARADGVTTAWTSKLVSQLEKHLGAQLIVRTTRRLALTDVGRAYLERCERVLDDLDEAELAVSSLARAPRGKLRVSAPMSFGLARLGPLLAGFSAAFPEVELDVVLNDRRVDLVEEGFDVALRLAASLEDSSLVVRAIGSGDRYVCGAPAYLARRGVPRRPEDLATHACLRYALHDPPDRWSFEREGEHVSVRVSGAVLMNNSQALRDVAIAGAGLLLAPDFAVADALADGRLVRVLHEWLPSGYRVFGVSPPARYGSLKTRAFVDFVARALATPKSPRLPS